MFWTLFLATLVGSMIMLAMDADADTTYSGYTGAHYLDNDDEYGEWWSNYYGHPPPVRGMNGTLWTFDNFETTPNTVAAIWAHFSTDKGHTWNDIMLIDQDDAGFSVGGYPRTAIDACVLSNNSLIVLVELYAYNTNNNIELWMFCHWNNTDLSQWERVPVHVSETYDVVGWSSGCVTNSTDIVWTYYRGMTGGDYFYSWDMTTRAGTQRYVKYPAYTARANERYLMVNSTDQILFAFGNGASPEYLYCYRIPQGTQWFSKGGSSSYYWLDCVVTLDDTVVAVSSISTGGQYDKLYYYNDSGNAIFNINQAGEIVGHPRLGLAQADPTWVWVFGYDTTSDEFCFRGQKYYKGSTPWQASYAAVWSESETSVKTEPWIGPRDHYPNMWNPTEEETVYTQLPNVGWIFPFSDYDVAADNWDHWIIHLNSTTWMGIPWYYGDPPEIITGSLNQATYNQWYTFTVVAQDGETPYIWSILVGPAWLSIGSSNGTLYGLPPAVTSYAVTVRVTETHDAPRWDDKAFTLTVKSAASGPSASGGGEGAWAISAAMMADLWTLFIITAVFVGLSTAYRKYVERVHGFEGARRRWSRTRRPLYAGYRKKRGPPKPYYRETRYTGRLLRK